MTVASRRPDSTPPTPAPTVDSLFAEATRLLGEERFEEALLVLSGALPATGARPDVLLLTAVLLTHLGRFHDAEAVCLKLRAADAGDAGAWYVHGLTRESLGDLQGGARNHRKAAQVDPTFAMPHLQLGRLARRAGDLPTARRELSVALGLLEQEAPARLALFAGGFPRGVLIAVCRGELTAVGTTA